MLLRRITEHVKAQNWTAVALDFVIVVLGVYTAVWIEGIEGRAEEKIRTAQVIETLRGDLRGSSAVENSFNTAIKQGLQQWEEDFEAGKLPPPYYFRVPGSDTAPVHTWDTLLSMNLGELLHPDLVFDLSFFFSERYGVGQKYIRYVEFVEENILPNLDEDSAVFYVADGSRLKPEFSANMDRLRDFLNEQQANIRGPNVSTNDWISREKEENLVRVTLSKLEV